MKKIDWQVSCIGFLIAGTYFVWQSEVSLKFFGWWQLKALILLPAKADNLIFRKKHSNSFQQYCQIKVECEVNNIFETYDKLFYFNPSWSKPFAPHNVV